MNSLGQCWPCAHGDHENCAGEQEVCFCPKCWDNDDSAGVDTAHDQAVEMAALVAGGG